MFKRMLSSVFIFVMFFQATKLDACYSSADLPTVDGKIYHLSLTASDLAPNIILVGDPDRAPFLAKHCLATPYTTNVSHRGLCTITGTTKNGLPLSIVTSGMGTPSTEIIVNELAILNEIVLKTRTRRDVPLYRAVNIIRLGTSGGLQAETELGKTIISAYAVGLDNTGLFYDVPVIDTAILDIEKQCQDAVDKAVSPISRFAHKIHPYAAAASPEIVQALKAAALEENVGTKIGITASNAGFFANQGRDISRIALTIPNIDGILSLLDFETEKFGTIKIENMEMEASFMFHFFGGLNFAGNCPTFYRVGAVCPAIANRRLETFDGHYEANLLSALHVILKAFEKLNSSTTEISSEDL